MSFGINPISAEATRKALVENDRTAANQNAVATSRAALDAEELRDLEHSLYVPTGAHATPLAAETAVVPSSATARSSLLARLLRRR